MNIMHEVFCSLSIPDAARSAILANVQNGDKREADNECVYLDNAHISRPTTIPDSKRTVITPNVEIESGNLLEDFDGTVTASASSHR
jgi:hypothetical protein